MEMQLPRPKLFFIRIDSSARSNIWRFPGQPVNGQQWVVATVPSSACTPADASDSSSDSSLALGLGIGLGVGIPVLVTQHTVTVTRDKMATKLRPHTLNTFT